MSIERECRLALAVRLLECRERGILADCFAIATTPLCQLLRPYYPVLEDSTALNRISDRRPKTAASDDRVEALNRCIIVGDLELRKWAAHVYRSLSNPHAPQSSERHSKLQSEMPAENPASPPSDEEAVRKDSERLLHGLYVTGVSFPSNPLGHLRLADYLDRLVSSEVLAGVFSALNLDSLFYPNLFFLPKSFEEAKADADGDGDGDAGARIGGGDSRRFRRLPGNRWAATETQRALFVQAMFGELSDFYAALCNTKNRAAGSGEEAEIGKDSDREKTRSPLTRTKKLISSLERFVGKTLHLISLCILSVAKELLLGSSVSGYSRQIARCVAVGAPGLASLFARLVRHAEFETVTDVVKILWTAQTSYSTAQRRLLLQRLAPLLDVPHTVSHIHTHTHRDARTHTHTHSKCVDFTCMDTAAKVGLRAFFEPLVAHLRAEIAATKSRPQVASARALQLQLARQRLRKQRTDVAGATTKILDRKCLVRALTDFHM